MNYYSRFPLFLQDDSDFSGKVRLKSDEA